MRSVNIYKNTTANSKFNTTINDNINNFIIKFNLVKIEDLKNLTSEDKFKLMDKLDKISNDDNINHEDNMSLVSYMIKIA